MVSVTVLTTRGNPGKAEKKREFLWQTSGMLFHWAKQYREFST